MHEFAVGRVLDIYDTPAVFTAADGLAVDDHVVFRANNRKRDDFLAKKAA